MARVKRGVAAKKRHKKILEQAKGYYGNKSRSSGRNERSCTAASTVRDGGEERVVPPCGPRINCLQPDGMDTAASSGSTGPDRVDPRSSRLAVTDAQRSVARGVAKAAL